MQTTPIQGNPEFDWEAFEAGCTSKKGYNLKVSAKYPDARVYSTEPYALELYEAMMGYEVHVKDYNDGDVVQVSSMKIISENEINFDLVNGLAFSFDMTKERRWCTLYAIDPENCKDLSGNDIDNLLEAGIYIAISTKGNGIKGSLGKGHEAKIRQEFLQQIKEPTSAYIARVVTRNKGGFIVNVQGVEAFLPGGLAAANKIIDFEEYMSKDITVMIEDQLKDTGTFIVSNKKYIKHILPMKMAELSEAEMYTGNVTGTAKYGIFVEWDEMFTGLLHYSKMTPDTRDKFKARGFKPGDELNFWIKEITKDNRIILSEEDPAERMNQIDDFKQKNLGVVKNGKVVSIKPFGTLVKLEKDIIGLVSKKELKAKKKFFEVGDDIIVSVDDIQKDKIYLSLIDESKELHED